MKKNLLLKYTAYCATALLTVILPTGVVIDLEPMLRDVAAKLR